MPKTKFCFLIPRFDYAKYRILLGVKVHKPRTSTFLPSHDHTPVSKEIPPISSKIEIAELCFSWLKYFWAEGGNSRHTIVRRCNGNKADVLGFWIMWSNNQRNSFFSWNGRGFFGSRFLLSNLMMIFYLQWTVHSLHDAKTHGDEWMKCDFLVIFFSFHLVVGVMLCTCDQIYRVSGFFYFFWLLEHLVRLLTASQSVCECNT